VIWRFLHRQMEYLYLSIYLPISQTLGRDLDCHASTTIEIQKERKYTGCIVKNRLNTLLCKMQTKSISFWSIDRHTCVIWHFYAGQWNIFIYLYIFQRQQRKKKKEKNGNIQGVLLKTGWIRYCANRKRNRFNFDQSTGTLVQYFSNMKY
jgi:hypothetical protein